MALICTNFRFPGSLHLLVIFTVQFCTHTSHQAWVPGLVCRTRTLWPTCACSAMHHFTMPTYLKRQDAAQLQGK